MKIPELESEKFNHPKGRRWSIRDKREALEAIDSGAFTHREVMEMYGIGSNGTLANWRRQLSRPVQHRRRFTETEKRRIAYEVGSGLLSVEEAMEQNGVLYPGTIPKWIARYGHDPELAVMAKRPKNEPEKGKQYPSAEEELEALRKELEHEKLKNLALETLIEVAEEELDIEIRKKPGAKQSEECEDDTDK